MKTALIVLMAALAVYGQSPVNQTQGPPPIAYQRLFFYDGSNNLQYICWAPSDQLAETTIAISAASNANPVVFTYTGGFDYQSGATTLPAVKITGGTGGWAAVNGVWLATPLSATILNSIGCPRLSRVATSDDRSRQRRETTSTPVPTAETSM